MNLLIASTNPAKIDRYIRYFDLLSSSLQILSLNDLDPQRLIVEPVESGDDEIANSVLKAQYYQEKLSFQGLVFAEDSGMILYGVDEIDNPRKDIKKPVLQKFGEVTPENLAKYYSELAVKYGGKIQQEWVFGYTLLNLDKTVSKTISSPSLLVQQIQYPIDPGYPLNSVTRIVKNDQEVYLSLLDQQEWQQHWDNEVIEVLKGLLGEISTTKNPDKISR